MPSPVRVPDDTSSLHAIGDFIMSYQPYQNAFLNALVNRIGRTIVTSKMWNNPWARFKRGYMEFGETVEEIFVNIAKPHSYDPATAESEIFKREIPDVRAAFHTMNYQKFYKATISNDQLRQAFLSWNGITDLIARIVDSLYTGMRKDEWLVMKYMVCRELLNGGFYPVQVDAVATDPTDSVTKFRQYTNLLTFLTPQYNRAGVETYTDVADQAIFISADAEAVIGTNVLADAFNMSEVDYLGQRVLVDSWVFNADDTARLAKIFDGDPAYEPIAGADLTTLGNVVAVKVDASPDGGWFMVFDNFENFTQNYNGEGLYWQYWYHAWKTFSVSPFANAVAFYAGESSITQVTVTPATADVYVGQSIQMSATVTGTGLIDKAVTWSVSGSKSPTNGTTIDPYSGILHVAADEVAETALTVTATAKDGETGTATITAKAQS